jgi:iron complex transport system substrate-binding protein
MDFLLCSPLCQKRYITYNGGERMKRKSIISVMFAIVFVLSALSFQATGKVDLIMGHATAGEKKAVKERTITDMDGNRVELPLPENIERVAILTSPTVQLIYIMGEQDKLCAMTSSQRRFKLFEKFYPRQKTIPAPRKCQADMNIEALLATNPQFCIGTRADMDVVRKSTSLATVTVYTLAPTRFFEYRKEELRLFGKIFGKPDRAEKYCAYLDNVLSDIQSKTTDIPEARRVKVFMGFGPKHMITYGGDTYMQDLIVASGCRNVADKLSTIAGKEGGLATVSMEQVLTWNPDIVIIDTGNPAALAKERLWAGITAVKNGNVFRLPVGGFMWNRPSAEAAVLLPRWLALKAYPDRFQGMKAEPEIKKYFYEILGFDLSDKDVKRILNPPDSPIYQKGK